MEYFKPKKTVSVASQITGESKELLRYYAQYARYDEDEVLDKFLRNLAGDSGFLSWAKSKRDNKKIIAILTNLGVKEVNHDQGDKTTTIGG
jgi:hypothetical protein